jgi:anaerobic nitric oxide reductase transcription regulator
VLAKSPLIYKAILVIRPLFAPDYHPAADAGCDASALLRYEAHQFVPLAIDGLAQDVLGRRFALEGHPRLEAIARAGDVVRFPADSDLPDPYDGLIPGQESLKVHACVGLPLFAGQTLIGALTLDGMDADRFDSFSDEELRLIAALVAGALNNALLIARLKRKTCCRSRRCLPAAGAPGDDRPVGADAAAEKRDRDCRRLGFERAD